MSQHIDCTVGYISCGVIGTAAYPKKIFIDVPNQNNWANQNFKLIEQINNMIKTNEEKIPTIFWLLNNCKVTEATAR